MIAGPLSALDATQCSAPYPVGVGTSQTHTASIVGAETDRDPGGNHSKSQPHFIAMRCRCVAPLPGKKRQEELLQQAGDVSVESIMQRIHEEEQAVRQDQAASVSDSYSSEPLSLVLLRSAVPLSPVRLYLTRRMPGIPGTA